MQASANRHMRRLAGIGAAALVLVQATGASAWGAMGHRIIGRDGVAALPADMPPFLLTPAAVEAVGELAREPDRWKGTGKVHDNMRDAAHFTNLNDDGTIVGGPPLNALPPTLEDFDTALRASGSDAVHVGYLPYSIIDGWQQLTKDFAYWRVETYAIAHEADPARKAWFESDLKRRETLTLSDLGEWAHYVGDASQPLHVSKHYDGWDPKLGPAHAPYPNPKGFTNERVHAAFEGAFVRANITPDSVMAAEPPPHPCTAAIEICTEQYLAATLSQVEPFYVLQRAGAFVGSDPRGIAFATQRLAAGAAELRDLTVSAWAASRQMSVGYKPITLDQVEAGGVDIYDALYGRD